METVQIMTLAKLAGTWQAEADSGAGSPDRRATLRECADVLRMLCEVRFEDCPHAAPHRYCAQCPVTPCPIGLDQPWNFRLARLRLTAGYLQVVKPRRGY